MKETFKKNNYYFEILQKEIIQHSISDKWVDAKREWYVDSLLPNQDDTCICTHVIKERYLIKNKEKDEELIVGNVCIHQFDEKSMNDQVKNIKIINKQKNKITCVYCCTKFDPKRKLLHENTERHRKNKLRYSLCSHCNRRISSVNKLCWLCEQEKIIQKCLDCDRMIPKSEWKVRCLQCWKKILKE